MSPCVNRPGSHLKVEQINDYIADHVDDAAASEAASREHSFKRFTANGLQPGVVNSVAGDLILFDVSLFHGCCNAADPDYTDSLLRAICIMAMCPREMVAPETLYARRRAYELDEDHGGAGRNVGVGRKVHAEGGRRGAA